MIPLSSENEHEHLQNSLFVREQLWCIPHTLCSPITQVNVATKAALGSSCQSSRILVACLYRNPLLLLNTAANLPSLPPDQSLLTSLANQRLWTALEWTLSRPTRATPITPAAPGDQTDMGMFPVCLPSHLTVCSYAVCLLFFHDRNVYRITWCTSSSSLCCGIWCNALPCKLGLLCLSSEWAGHMLVEAKYIRWERDDDWDRQSLWIRVVTAEWL